MRLEEYRSCVITASERMGMIPRGTPDIGWSDLVAGLVYCLWQDDPEQTQARVEARWSASRDSLASLSVRSGFDALLRALALPPGSEVLVSAITIPDMLYILEQHGLVAVPLDIDPLTLAVDTEIVARAIGPNTKAILLAHLFGSRMALDPIVRIARQHDLLMIEDCAQAYDTSAYRGHPASDISMFSFGPIKTATALGGALLRFKHPALLARVRAIQKDYPRQPWPPFLRRLGRFALLKLLATPLFFSIFVALCRLRGIDHDHLLRAALRGFGGTDLLPRIRQQPCAPLLRLLERRVTRRQPRHIRWRVDYVRRLIAVLPAIPRPGTQAAHHTHWVVPIESRDPDALVAVLGAYGFDATRRASSLIAVPPPAGRTVCAPAAATQMLDRLVYLPMYPWMKEDDITRLGRIIMDFEMAGPVRATASRGYRA